VLILIAPNFLAVRNASGILESTYAESITFAICFWLLIFAIVPRLWMGLIVAILCSLWWPVEVFLRLDFAQPVTPTFVGMAMETDAREVSEFFATLGWSILLPVLFIFSSIVVGRHIHHGRIEWTHRSRWWILLAVPAILCAPVLMYINEGGPAKTAEPFVSRAGSLLARFGAVYPLDLPLSIFSIRQDASIVRQLRAELAGFDFELKLTSAYPDTVVVVIGESSRSDRWQLFGYERHTTPRLSSMSDLILFPDVATESVATRYAVPNLISRRPLLRSDGSVSLRPEPSILAALKQVGYRTFWLSNQGVGGFYESPIAMYASDADEATYFNPTSYDARGTYDEVLVEPLRRKLDISGKKFIVVHTLGSHFDFSHRYPPAFDIYRPSLTTVPAQDGIKNNSSLAVQVSNAYDNSIEYTDFLLSRIIEAVSRKGDAALVMYISDHGQDVFDEQCKAMSITRNSSHSFTVPAFIWASEKARLKIGDRLAMLSKSRAQPKNSSAVPQTLLDLVGVATPIDSRTASWFDEGHRPRRVFANNGWADFDKSIARNPCEIRP
jgi:glucan phosphoethanolaminetransferase (alkaline phosphatase superfamily)